MSKGIKEVSQNHTKDEIFSDKRNSAIININMETKSGGYSERNITMSLFFFSFKKKRFRTSIYLEDK